MTFTIWYWQQLKPHLGSTKPIFQNSTVSSEVKENSYITISHGKEVNDDDSIELVITKFEIHLNTFMMDDGSTIQEALESHEVSAPFQKWDKKLLNSKII